MAKFAQQVEDSLVAVHNRLDAGQIGMEEFIALATALLIRAKAKGVNLADMAVAGELSVLRGMAVPALGLRVPDGIEAAAAKAVEDTVSSDQYKANAAAAVAVLGRAQALESVQDAYGQALRQQGVQAWTRVLNAGACELCQSLADGVLPASVDMYHHKGCGCSQKPVEMEQTND
jgi:hypothetical protein